VKAEQLILSIGTILLAARVFGWIFQHIGQPRVVGEMTAGIILGPFFFWTVLSRRLYLCLSLIVNAWAHSFESAWAFAFHVCGWA